MLVCWIKLLVDSFFFQAEDGIRDIGVTGVQTCALPIYLYFAMLLRERFDEAQDWCQQGVQRFPRDPNFVDRSEERRVGKECRSRWSAHQYKKKTTRTDDTIYACTPRSSTNITTTTTSCG